jgi:hypothetical protein
MEGRKMATIRHLKVIGPGNVKRTVALPVRKPNAVYRSREHLTEREIERLIEAAKVAPRTIRTAQQEGDRREMWRRYEISQRHWKLSLAIRDTPPPGWADDLYSDSYVAPDGWPPWG